MFRAINTRTETIAYGSGFRYQGISAELTSGVSPFTSPTSSLSGLRFVKKLMTIVTTKQMTHAHQALQKFAAMSLVTLESVSNLASNQLNFTARNNVKEEPMPARRPQNAPFGVIHRTNIPRSIVANRGAFTQEKIAYM